MEEMHTSQGGLVEVTGTLAIFLGSVPCGCIYDNVS